MIDTVRKVSVILLNVNTVTSDKTDSACLPMRTDRSEDELCDTGLLPKALAGELNWYPGTERDDRKPNPRYRTRLDNGRIVVHRMCNASSGAGDPDATDDCVGG